MFDAILAIGIFVIAASTLVFAVDGLSYLTAERILVKRLRNFSRSGS